MKHRVLFALAAALSLSACRSEAPPKEAAPAPVPPFTSDRISVTTRGKGPDIVLVHGLGGHPDVWNASVDALEAEVDAFMKR